MHLLMMLHRKHYFELRVGNFLNDCLSVLFDFYVELVQMIDCQILCKLHVQLVESQNEDGPLESASINSVMILLFAGSSGMSLLGSCRFRECAERFSKHFFVGENVTLSALFDDVFVALESLLVGGTSMLRSLLEGVPKVLRIFFEDCSRRDCTNTTYFAFQCNERGLGPFAIKSLDQGSPAALCGQVHPGDLLYSVDGRRVRDLCLRKSHALAITSSCSRITCCAVWKAHPGDLVYLVDRSCIRNLSIRMSSLVLLYPHVAVHPCTLNRIGWTASWRTYAFC